MEAIWYLDRAAALVAYPSLVMAMLTGILYNADSFGILHRAAKRVHIEVSVFAMLVTLLHWLVGIVDTWLVAAGKVPQPAYSIRFLLAGTAVGAGGLFLLIVAVLGFLDARRFDRPWGPKVIHAFAYGGYAFATIHAAAIGTDFVGLIRPVLVGTTVFLAYVLVLRILVDAEAVQPEASRA